MLNHSLPERVHQLFSETTVIMQSILILLSLFVVTFAVPLVPSTTVIPTSTLPAYSTTMNRLKEVPTPAKLRKMDISLNPYRFSYNRKMPSYASKSVHSTGSEISSPDMSHVLSKSNMASATNNEKNWLLTKAWLIDNINRLRRELSELERDYSQHLDSIERTNSQKEKQFIEDITKLRADHTVLSQQQKQIIYLIKKSQVLRMKPSENDIHYASVGMKSNVKSGKIVNTTIKRQIKRDLTQTYGDNFEAETRRNTKEMFAELSALHDISLTLYDDLRNLEHKMENRDKFK